MRKVFILALLVLTLSAFLTACGGGGSGGGGSYTLSISPMPTNGTVVSATAVGINCGSGGSACSASFSDTVVLNAIPDAGYTFAGWGGDCSSCGTMPICSINMNANKTCSANFTTTPTYTNAYVYQVSGDGSVLVGFASASGNIKPMVWRINAGSLSPGFYWLADIATQTNVLNTGLSSYPYGAVLGVTADGTVGCGYGSSRTDASTGDRALAWNLTTLQPIHLPDHSSGGNLAYACAKSGGDIYIVGRVYPNFPKPTIWKNYTIWHQNTSVAYGIFHDITPDASKASAQLVYQGWVYDLNNNQYTQLVSSIGGAYGSRISPDGQAVAFSNSNSGPGIKVWYGGNVYPVNMSVGAVRVRSGVAYVFGSDGSNSNAVRWRSDTTTMENLNTVFASVLPSGVTLKSISAVSLDNRVMVGVAYNPTTNRDEVFVLVGDPFQDISP
jgi:uncharacterized repeat protein (TIGR02543 family)